LKIGIPPQEAAKIHCIINYFNRVTEKETVPEGTLLFERRALSKFPDWKNITTPINIKMTVVSEGTIEDAEGALQVDFANKVQFFSV
jgi:hypothetical protein